MGHVSWLEWSHDAWPYMYKYFERWNSVEIVKWQWHSALGKLFLILNVNLIELAFHLIWFDLVRFDLIWTNFIDNHLRNNRCKSHFIIVVIVITIDHTKRHNETVCMGNGYWFNWTTCATWLFRLKFGVEHFFLCFFVCLLFDFSSSHSAAAR